jgi:hypothetical protein
VTGHPPVIALYDANVLYPAPLRDLLIRLARTGVEKIFSRRDAETQGEAGWFSLCLCASA